MKLNYKTALLASSLFLASSFAAAAQTPPQQTSPKAPAANAGQTPVDPSHVIAVINGKPLTAGQLDEWAKVISPAQDMTVEQRRLQTLRVLVNLEAFAAAARSEKLDETQDYRQRYGAYAGINVAAALC